MPRMRMLYVALAAVFAAWLSLLIPKLHAQEGIAQLIMDKILARIFSEAGARNNLKCDLISMEERYDSSGKLKSRKPARPGPPKVFKGRPKIDGIDLASLYKILDERYDFYIDDQESIGVMNGIVRAIVKFKPKSNLKIRETADQFVNRLSGKIYIDLDELYMVKLNGTIDKTFSFTITSPWILYIPVTVTVYRVNFMAEYELSNGIVVENLIIGEADYETRGRGTVKRTYTLSNCRM